MATWTLDTETTHLNHGSFGATPIEVLAVQQELRQEMERNPVAFMLRRYQPLLELNRAAVAEFVGADPAGLVFVPNATSGVNAVLRSLEPSLRRGAEIVITNHTYNACRNAAAETVRRVGGRLVVAEIPFPIERASQATEAILAAITNDTALVIVDHVTSPTALVLPIAEIAAGLGDRVPVLVDGAHAPGMLDVDLRSLNVNFYTANCHKWMCSPKGAGFLWVDERWRSHMYPVAISHGYNGQWPTSASEFHANFDWTGTDDPTARLSVAEAISVMASHAPGGWPEIRSNNHRLVLEGRGIVSAALGSELPAPESMVGSLAALRIPPAIKIDGGLFDPAADALSQRWRIEVPVFAWPEERQYLLRVSAQVYNHVADYERLAEAITASI